MLKDLLYLSAKENISKQLEDGSFVSGSNGPYKDYETPVRNTAHWLTLFCRILNEKKDAELENAAHKAVDYLLSEKARPHGAAFYCRDSEKKDSTNGLIGQAWAMESLVEAFKNLGRVDAMNVAKEVFFMHPWLKNEYIWKRISVDGSHLSIDGTFNHQLWFAAIGAQLDDHKAKSRAHEFLSHVARNVETYPDGIIYHASSLGGILINGNFSIIKVIYRLYDKFIRTKMRSKLRLKSVGYHGFNMYAFGMLKESFPDHDIWKSKKILSMVEVVSSKTFNSELDRCQYGWQYNPPGIEIAFMFEVFGYQKIFSQDWIDRQIKKCHITGTTDITTGLSDDTNTLLARVYEASRLKNSYKVDLAEFIK
jgi:hypothetical protein